MSINIKSFIDVKRSISNELFEQYCLNNKIKIKNHEVDCIEKMLSNFDSKDQTILFDKFNVSYSIPQIGKEFDLIRISVDKILNIELKSEFDLEKMINQCIRNYYFLSIRNFSITIIMYDYCNNDFYKFISDKTILEKIPKESIIEYLVDFGNGEVQLNEVFVPTDYLVSPFNNTIAFLSNKYFLTSQQEEIKNDILKGSSNVNVITGGAGTGKTLLLYDIFKTYKKQGKHVVLIHCGLLNEGQIKLKKAGYLVFPIKELQVAIKKLNGNGHILVDEAQRISKYQLESIFKSTLEKNVEFVFSLDVKQTLAKFENGYEVISKICEMGKTNIHKLSGKIRTNIILNDFILSLINSKFKSDRNYRFSECVQYTYLSSVEEGRQYASKLRRQGYIVINPTESLYNSEVHRRIIVSGYNAHQVIGQEFDFVAVIVPEYFRYNSNGDLSFNKRSYYEAPQMLYQAITRARKKLFIIIVNNPIILSRMISIGL